MTSLKITPWEQNRNRNNSPLIAILVGILISLLVHQVIFSVADYFYEYEPPVEKKETKIVMLHEEQPEVKKLDSLPLPVLQNPPEVASLKNKIAPKPKPKSVSPPKLQPIDVFEADIKSSQIAQMPAGPPIPMPSMPSMPNVSQQPATDLETQSPVRDTIQTKMSWGMFEKTFSDAANRERAVYEAANKKKRGGGVRFGAFSQKVLRSVNANSSWVAAAQQVPLGDNAELFHNYLEVAHIKIHQLFGYSFLGSLNKFDVDDPLNDFSLMAKMEFEILANGHINDIHVIKTSGNTVFDAAAVDSLYRSAPFPKPPLNIRSWNDRVYFRWGFYRNNRMCGVRNAEPYMLKAPGAIEEPISRDKFIITN